MAKKKFSLEPRRGIPMGQVATLLVIALIVIAVFMILIMQRPAEPSTTKELLEKSAEAMGSKTRESFTFDGFIRVSAGSLVVAIPISGEGRIDSGMKKMYFKINMEAPGLGTATETSTIEGYVMGDTFYSNSGSGWTKATLPGGLWGDTNVPNKFLKVLAKLDSQALVSKVINGKDSYGITVDPNVEDIVKEMDLLQPGLLLPLDEQGLEELEDSLEISSLSIWVAKNSFLPIRAETELSISSGEWSTQLGGIQNLDVDLQFTVNLDFETPFTIVLPPEAEMAPEV
jgi:hypothetical protein